MRSGVHGGACCAVCRCGKTSGFKSLPLRQGSRSREIVPVRERRACLASSRMRSGVHGGACCAVCRCGKTSGFKSLPLRHRIAVTRDSPGARSVRGFIAPGTLAASRLRLSASLPQAVRAGCAVFASLRPHFRVLIRLSASRHNASARSSGAAGLIASLAPISASWLRLSASLPQAGETVWCSLRSPPFLLPSLRVSPASGRDGVVFASLAPIPSSVSPLRGETRAKRAERGDVDWGDAGAASREGGTGEGETRPQRAERGTWEGKVRSQRALRGRVFAEGWDRV